MITVVAVHLIDKKAENIRRGVLLLLEPISSQWPAQSRSTVTHDLELGDRYRCSRISFSG